jgi:ABC-type multidrug transport system ATPase subunit
MRQRLGIAQALIGEPELIIVDEPTAGLDPEERNRFHNLIAETGNENTVVLLSTHIVSDVSNLCSRMAILRHGKILSACSPRQAVDELKGSVWEGNVAREQISAFKSQFNVISSRMFDDQARVRVISKGQRPSGEFTATTPVLEDYYFDLVNRQN